MEADCGAGKSHRRGFLTTRSLREAWPEGAYDGAKQPQRERWQRALRRKARREDSETALGGFELRKNVRLANVGRPDLQGIDNVGGR